MRPREPPRPDLCSEASSCRVKRNLLVKNYTITVCTSSFPLLILPGSVCGPHRRATALRVTVSVICPSTHCLTSIHPSILTECGPPAGSEPVVRGSSGDPRARCGARLSGNRTRASSAQVHGWCLMQVTTLGIPLGGQVGFVDTVISYLALVTQGPT